MPQDIPGFYYDPEKNRYFTIKSPMPGSAPSSSYAPKKAVSKPTKVTKSCRRIWLKTSKLLQFRELHGNSIASNKGNCNFEEEFQKSQASCPLVWKYSGTQKIPYGALEQIHMGVQTPEGQTQTDVLLTGGRNNSLSFFEVGKVGQSFDYGTQCIPDLAWPIIKGNRKECSKFPRNICRPARGSLLMSSNISSIKLFRKNHPCATDDGSNIPHALISTLGSESHGGSLCVLNLVEPLDFYSTRIQEVGMFNCTIWTADCGFNENRAVIGTSRGAALVDLGTGWAFWMLHSKSDVLAQQLVHSGNVVLCGLRNGAIVTVDVRQRPESVSDRVVRPRTHQLPLDNTAGKSTQRWFKLSGNICRSQTVFLPSSISCLASLMFDDQYFLASSMDGSVKLYDLRLVQRGSIQSYEGHVNSHTRIQIGVDPSEKFLMSGGEDCNLRLWSIKSGELLFEDKFSSSVPSTVCWRRAERLMVLPDEGQSFQEYFQPESYESGAWLGSQEGLFYMQW
ncbi:uncharacterized protein LOC107411560 isoform X2 [Ziziphus jujuba]|uniref:Uncharacterized protein LOC107411560 isoform X2 n=1 Tax=Ziziphus jujuba TaxID=326968 RepID=A0ABM3I061_ZIZJJ|nr:uncharacterized protein LOC107411560 isoform X2 [Ziziphus jujuba]